MNNISPYVSCCAKNYFGLSLGLRITDDIGGKEGSEEGGQKGSAHRLGHRGRRAKFIRTGREKGKDEEAWCRKLEQQQRLRLSEGITHEIQIMR